MRWFESKLQMPPPCINANLLISSGPGSFPHHKAFGRAALLVHGCCGRSPERHLCLVLNHVSHLFVTHSCIFFATIPGNVLVLTVTHIFFFQIKEVVNGLIHKFRASYDCHKVRVSSSALGKPEINLKADIQNPIKNHNTCQINHAGYRLMASLHDKQKCLRSHSCGHPTYE